MMEATYTTTDINDLPHAGSEPIHSGQSVAIDEGQIRQLVTGIQEASLKGATRLRSSDIPQDPLQITTDSEIVKISDPTPINIHPIAHPSSSSSIFSIFDNIPTELRIPIIMGVLAGSTQLPIVNQYIKPTFTWMYTEHGLSWYGWIAYIIIFSIIWYILGKVVPK